MSIWLWSLMSYLIFCMVLFVSATLIRKRIILKAKANKNYRYTGKTKDWETTVKTFSSYKDFTLVLLIMMIPSVNIFVFLILTVSNDEQFHIDKFVRKGILDRGITQIFDKENE